MSLPDLLGDELIAWVERTATQWQQLLENHPDALTLPCDIRETTTVAELVQHIVAVELRYSERLCGLPETSYDSIRVDSVASLYSIHRRAMELLGELRKHEDNWWQESIQFGTRSGGEISAPRKVVFVHLLMHSVRHYAQLATLLRQHGVAPDWMMDYLDMRPK